MRRRLVVGNWKMHGSRERVSALLQNLMVGAADGADGPEIAVAPSYIHIGPAREMLADSAVKLAAQNLYPEPEGAFTGEVSAAMLADYGVSYAIIGHSERRRLFRETDAEVAARFRSAQDNGLTPILCVGESLEQREQGVTGQTVLGQLNAIIDTVGVQAFNDAVIAYEPVWAIGTGHTATPGQAQHVHCLLRDHLADLDAAVAAAVRIIYGGSVKSGNARKLFREADIDGALVGGASLSAEEFIAICKTAD